MRERERERPVLLRYLVSDRRLTIHDRERGASCPLGVPRTIDRAVDWAEMVELKGRGYRECPHCFFPGPLDEFGLDRRRN